MKNLKILFSLLMVLPYLGAAQSIVGSWVIEGEDDNGNTVQSVMTFNEDGTFGIDFGSNGTTEVSGVYSVAGDKITIKDTSEGADCLDMEGVYQMEIKGDMMTSTAINDPCTNRKSGSPYALKKM